MKTRMGFWKENRIFIIISVVVLLFAFISIFSGCIGENPFSRTNNLINPVNLYSGDNFFCYISESSNKISVTDKNNDLIYTIKGNNTENTFECVEAAVIDSDGTLYVHDKVYKKGSSAVCTERILRFSKNGMHRSILYEVETLNDNDEQVIYLDSPALINGDIYFSRIDADGIHVLKVKDGNTTECTFMSLRNGYDIVADSSFNENMEIAAVTMNGDVYVCRNKRSEVVYYAREHDTDEYASLVSEIVYGNNGVLYLCDAGLRQIYKMSADKQQIQTVISRNFFSENDPGDLVKSEIYTGITFADNRLSMLVCDNNDKSSCIFRLASVSKNYEKLMYTDTTGISMGRRILIIFVYIAVLLIGVISVYAAVKIIIILKDVRTESGIRLKFIILGSVLTVTVCVSYYIFKNYNSRLIKEMEINLSNLSYLIEAKIDKSVLEEINCPDDYYKENYKILCKDVTDILENEVNFQSDRYCIIYKPRKGIWYEAYREDMIHGPMYPITREYTDFIESGASSDNECRISYKNSLSKGICMFAIIPVYDQSHNIMAYIETGTNFEKFAESNHEINTKVLMLAAMAVIIVMLLLSELISGIQAFKTKKINSSTVKICSPEMIRPVSFIFFFIANISTAFLPIYGMQLWREDFPFPSEISAAFPLSAELVTGAVSALTCGFFIRKTGIRPVCIIGAVLYIISDVLSAFAQNLPTLICANAICGIGSGFLTVSINTWATGYDDEELCNRGFININAAHIAGLNCGTVIGSFIWESFGVSITFLSAALGALLLIIISIFMMGSLKHVSEEKITEKKNLLKEFFSPEIIKYFLCVGMPYVLCGSFLGYYFPIEAEANGLSAVHISMAFLLSGLTSIYIGSIIAEPVTVRLGIKKSMILASFIYASALIYFAINPSIISCYFVIFLFAVANSFGLSAQSVYFTSVPAVKKIGQDMALGVRSTFESITSACGPLVFGGALIFGRQKGFFMIASAFSLLLVMFVIKKGRK